MASGEKIRPRRFIPGTTLLLTVLLSISSAAVMAAGGGDDEDSLIRQGVESRRNRNDAGALDLFQKAYDLRHSPRAAAQMGWAEIALGRWVDAAGHLEEAIAGAADPWVAKHLSTLKESLDRVRQHVGELEILGGPPRAEIAIEGVVVGTLPLAKPLRVRSGDCRFIVRASGYEPVSRTVEVSPGQLTRETVNLSEAATPLRSTQDSVVSTRPVVAANDQIGAAAPQSGGRADSAPATAGDSPPGDSPPGGAPAGGSRLPTVGIVLGSVGLVAVAAGVFFGLKARAAGREAAVRPTFDPDAESAGHRYEVLQYVGYGVGGALLAAGITTFVLGINHNRDSSPRQVAVIPWSGGGLAILTGRF